jgi:drug efflux transport system permease protein
MKRFWSFVRKEFYHIFRDKQTLLVLFGLPIALIMIFGYVITSEINNAKIAIYDPSKDEATTEIIQKLLASDYFILVENLENTAQIESIFKKGLAKEVIVFETDFAKKLEENGTAQVQLIADASDANTANIIVNYTTAILMNYVKTLNQNSTMPLQIVTQTRMVYNEEMKGSYMFIPGTMALILMLVSALMTSVSIAREKEMGTMEILLVSPLKPIQIILGKVTPYILLSFVNAVSILLLGYYVFGVPIHGNLLLLVAEVMLFILLALSLGLFISTMSNSQQSAMFISLFTLMLPTILLSGFIFPVENMPEILQYLSAIVPPKYFIIIIKNIMLKGTGMSFIWKETLVLLGMTIFFIVLSIKKFKVRLD